MSVPSTMLVSIMFTFLIVFYSTLIFLISPYYAYAYNSSLLNSNRSQTRLMIIDPTSKLHTYNDKVWKKLYMTWTWDEPCCSLNDTLYHNCMWIVSSFCCIIPVIFFAACCRLSYLISCNPNLKRFGSLLSLTNGNQSIFSFIHWYKCFYIPAVVKLSTSFSEVLLRHITVVSFSINILDAVTCSVEVKLALKLLPLTLMRVAVNGSRLKTSGGVSIAKYEVGWVMSGLRHSRELDSNTRQVNVTRSPGHANWLVLLEFSCTLPTMRAMTKWRQWIYFLGKHGWVYVKYLTTSNFIDHIILGIHL